MNKTVICALFLSLTMVQVAFAQAPSIRAARRPIPNQYVVILAADDDPEAIAAQTSAVFGGRVKHVYRNAVRGFAVRLTRGAATALAADPRVLYIEEDGTVEASEIQLSPTWGLDRIDARSLPLDGSYKYPAFGPLVYVHVIDTGIRPSHVEFGGRAFIAGDFVDDDGDGDPTDVGNDDGNSSIPDGADCHGHGTHVAATIGGATYGVAKNVVINAYRALDCTAEGSISAIIAAVDAITADPRRPAVANMSLGGDPSNALDEAVRRSIAAGITYAIAAGNASADANSISPARVAEAITVGATAANDTKASWSNFGPRLDLFAPGVSIVSAGHTSDTAVRTLSGTSMAAPHVAGVAALYLEQSGNRSPQQVRDALVAAATNGVVVSPGIGSPNLLLYSGFLTVEAEDTRLNVALAANGGSATASSTYGSTNYLPSAAINGDRRGAPWGGGGGWQDGNASFPDWLEVAFSGPKSIDEISVFSLQDSYKTPVEPTPTQTFTLYGLIDFTVQYWTGSAWQAVPGGVVRGNSLVWARVTFPALTTSRIRVLVERTPVNVSRIVEVEAFEAAGGVNTPPSVNLTAPASGAVFTAPATINLAAGASDIGGAVSGVAFHANGTLIGTDSTSPYSFTWSGVAAGSYTLTAVATDDDGATTTSVPVTVTVNGSGGGTRLNVALAANGGSATASSTYGSTNYLPSAAINGDRRGAPWGNGGGWQDASAGFPDWLEVAFSGPKTIDEINVFSLQDSYKTPVAPTPTLTFTLYGLVDFTVQYWTGSAWQAVPGGVVRGNSLVWASVTFPRADHEPDPRAGRAHAGQRLAHHRGRGLRSRRRRWIRGVVCGRWWRRVGNECSAVRPDSGRVERRAAG